MRVRSMFTAGMLAIAPAAASAQVSGAIILGGGPVRGVVTVGVPLPPVVIDGGYYYPGPGVVVVQPWRGYGRYDRYPGYERRWVYYDPRGRVFYDRHRRGYRKVEVWGRDGRYWYDDRHFDGRDRDDHRDGDRHRDWDR